MLDGTINKDGEYRRKSSYEVKEGRELAYFIHNKFNKVLWGIQMCLFI